MLLGFNTLRTLVLASALASSFDAPKGFDYKAFWRHNFLVANLCRWLAKQVKADAETAYTCGLMSDIGSLLAVNLRQEKAAKVAELVAQGNESVAAQREVFGFTYNEAGAELLNTWRFPVTMVDAIREKEAAKQGDSASTLSNILVLAEFLADKLDQGKAEFTTDLPASYCGQLGLTAEQLQANTDAINALNQGLDAML